MVFAPVTMCYLVLWIGFGFRINRMTWCNQTDLSYGVYLFAFPVQQMLAALGIDNPWIMFTVATPLVMGIAFLSWNLVEKPCLKLKSRKFSDCDPGLVASP
jgi:peptidoglycan/LPS O-acetylase OafA/YrhL